MAAEAAREGEEEVALDNEEREEAVSSQHTTLQLKYLHWAPVCYHSIVTVHSPPPG